MIFKHIYNENGTYWVKQIRDDGRERKVDSDYGQYVSWLALGNTPEEVAYVAPEPVEPEPERLSIEDRLAALEMIALEGA